MMTRRLSNWIAIPLLLTLFGSLADDLAHLTNHDSQHREVHSLAGVSDSTQAHGDCDAWQAENVEHGSHQESQFELASALHHGDHAALCPACSYPVSATTSEVETLSGSAAQVFASPSQGPRTTEVSYGFSRPRAPPRA